MIGRLMILAAVWSTLAGMHAPAAPDWQAALRVDAQALHDDIAANHPGPINPEDPGFAGRNDAQLRLALHRADGARSFAAYFFAMRAYIAAFDDGHLSFGVYGSTPSDTHWPGFFTRYEADGSQRVFERAEDAPVPLGARLLDCDGQSADRLAEALVGNFIGRWTLLSQRLFVGRMLFADQGNPYVQRPVICTFDVAGQPRRVTLDWRPIDNGEMSLKLWPRNAQPSREIGARVLADGTRWISLGSFDADPGSEAGRALPPLIAALRADRAALAAAPAIVLDLRGNTGGSSDWSRQIAEIIWGHARLAALPRGPTRVDWRVSAANLASLRENRDRQVGAGALSPEMRRWFDRVTTGLEGALARGETLWRETEDDGEPSGGPAAPDGAKPEGPIYFITDARRASACLDAVDLWRGLGAAHLGQTTSADSFYMDVRDRKLPSGLGAIVVPRKVYRGRSRGSNQPVVPMRQFAGDIADTPALERWVAGLRH